MKRERRADSGSKYKKINLILLISVGFFVYMVTISLLREGGIPKVWKLNKKLSALTNEIIQLKKENNKLEGAIIGLREGNSHIDRVAREELGMVKEGEIIYKFIREDK